jgi:hypothetical protein
VSHLNIPHSFPPQCRILILPAWTEIGKLYATLLAIEAKAIENEKSRAGEQGGKARCKPEDYTLSDMKLKEYLQQEARLRAPGSMG